MGELARRHEKAAAKKAPAKKVPAKKVPAKKVPAKKKAAAKKVPAKKKAPAKTAPAKKKHAAGGRNPTRRPSSAGPAMALPAPPNDPLVVLGLAESFSAAQLRRAWRTYATRHHPDQGGDAATFARGRTAYEALLRET